MLGSLPPYALPAPVFRFAALAALAGRRPMGGEREVALAAFVSVRLVVGVLPASMLTADARARRATGARAWLAAVTLPAATRAPIARLIDVTAQDDIAPVVTALGALVDAIGRTLDAPARREIEQLIDELNAAKRPALPL